MEKFMIIGERIHCISPIIRKALAERNPEPIRSWRTLYRF